MRDIRTVLSRRRRSVGVAVVLMVLVVGLGGSWVAAIAADRVQQRHAARMMDQYADDVGRAVANETGRYRDALSDIAASIGAQSDFSAGDFTAITLQLSRQRLPGATGVLFAVAATDDRVADVQAYWRGKGASGLVLAPTGTGLEHMLVVFNRPFDASTPVYGRDVSQAPEPAEALRTSRDTGQVTASHTYVLLKDRALPTDQQQMSFLLAAPVRAAIGTPDQGRFRGWVFMGMRGGDFIQETLRTQSRGAVGVTLIDVSAATPVIVASSPAGIASSAGPLNRLRTVAVGQRAWQLRVQPTDTLMTAYDRRTATLTRWLGLLATVLLTALVGVLAGARHRALTKVDRATTALRDDIEARKVTEARLRERESELRHLAFHDPLTGLANRTLFYERVEHALVTHHRSGSTLAVLFIDLDGFKQVNDSLGHQAGDAVLTEVAARLSRCVRASDTLARLGGDEFAILAEQLASPTDAKIIAEKVVRAVQQSFAVDDQPANVTVSVGVAIQQPGRVAADDIVHRADDAMYHAKLAGKNRYFIAEDHDESLRHLSAAH